MLTKSDVLRISKDAELQVIRLWFTDILGQIKGLNLPIEDLEMVLDEGHGFDGSSVEGFVRIEESDLLVVPDPRTFRILPWEHGGAKTGILICDVTYPDGRPFESDPRYVLQRMLTRAGENGFDNFYVGPELEYFYFPDDKHAEILDRGGYFDVMPMDHISACRKQTYMTLRKMGIKVDASHHEVSPSQHELGLSYTNALEMADKLMITKAVVKEVARENDLYASFMPKPLAQVNGSGMHVHFSLFSGAENRFYSKEDPYNLSNTARRFIAGILRHAREITAVTNQWVNSYKRLVVGYEAPVYICWGRRNRSALVRVPAFKPHHPNSCRAEFRSPDPAANPYLLFAVMLGAGMAGLDNDYELIEPVEEDIYGMPEKVQEERGIKALPDSLYAAILFMEESDLVRDILGTELFEKYIANKRAEWEQYRIQVTDYEVETYLPKL